ncbi:hypothetical protein [Peptoniphilus raoultii]|uniref:hypothetical protein n=1 Tax=Peptoniphilus raoultii TaxID=1776387 RepID=UPI0008DAC1AF|nr:hypothetical protein [Peptoniphilus raoultii]
MKEKFRKFMVGRYGADAFGRFLLLPVLILLIIGYVKLNRYCHIGALVILIYIYYRMFSRNISARYRENQKFLDLTKPIRRQINYIGIRIRDRKDYKFTRCPYCNLEMRLPKNKGKVIIKCKKCKNTFEFRT